MRPSIHTDETETTLRPASVMSYYIISCHIMSYHITSHHVMSCHIMSCHIMSYLSCHVILYHVISSHVTAYSPHRIALLDTSCLPFHHFNASFLMSCHCFFIRRPRAAPAVVHYDSILLKHLSPSHLSSSPSFSLTTSPSLSLLFLSFSFSNLSPPHLQCFPPFLLLYYYSVSRIACMLKK